MSRSLRLGVFVIALAFVPGIVLAEEPPDLPSVDLRTWDHLDEALRDAGVGSPVPSAGVGVDLFNGNAMLSLPLSNALPVGGGLSLSFGATYNSNSAHYEIDEATPVKLLRGDGPLGLGWTAHLGRIITKRRSNGAGSSELLYRALESPSGSLYKFSPNVNKAYPNLQFDYHAPPCHPDPINPGECVFRFFEDDYVVTDSAGTTYHYDLLKSYSETKKEWYLTSVADINGHSIEVDYWNVAEYPAMVIQRISSPDNPGVEIETLVCTAADVTAELCPVKGLIKSVTSTSFKGTRSTPMTVTYELVYSTVELTDDSAGSQPMDVPILVEVKLPTVAGSSVGSVLYDYADPAYGPLLSRITSPTGAVTEIQYGSWTAGNREASDRLQVGATQVSVFPDGVGGSSPSEFATTWDREFDFGSCPGTGSPLSAFVTHLPDGRKTVVEMGGDPCGTSSETLGALRTPKKVVTYDGDGVTELRTTEVVWNTIDEATEKGTKPVANKSTVKFHDDDGTCFDGETTSGEMTMTTESFLRNDWNQWRLTRVSGSYMSHAEPTRVEYTNFDSPDNVVYTDCDQIGAYDYAFVEQGSERAETNAVFDCSQHGRITSTGLNSVWQNSTTTITTDPSPVVTVTANTVPNDLLTSLTYDANTGDVLTATASGSSDPRSYQTTSTWSLGILKTAVSPLPPGGPSYMTSDRDIDPSGLVMAARDPNGLSSAFDYDELGRPTLLDPPGTQEYNTRIYYPDPKTVRTIVSPGTETDFDATNAEQLFTEQVADNLGRVVERNRVVPGDTLDELSVQVTRHDEFGRAVFVSEWMLESEYQSSAKTSWTRGDYLVSDVPVKSGRPWGTLIFYGTPATPGTTNPLNILPDGLGRVRRTETFDASATETNYCGPHSEVTSYVHTASGPAASTSRAYYDGLGRLVMVDNPTGADAVYSYDLNGQLIKVNLTTLPALPFVEWSSETPTFADGQIRSFTYDAAGRSSSSEYPESGKTEFHAYDALGNLLAWTDELGRARGYFFRSTYDEAGRLIDTKRVLGTYASPETEGRVVGSTDTLGDFEESADLGGPSAWDEGTIAADTFTAGTSDWSIAAYGGCVPAPPGGGTNDSGLYIGDVSDCSYNDVGAGPQAVRIALDDVARDDRVQFKYWRQVRQGIANKDKLTVLVTRQADDASLSSARILFRLDETQVSYGTWRQTLDLVPGDLFGDWAEGSEEDLYLYIVFEKGDTTTSGLGAGVMIDDVTVGRPLEEPLVQYDYDADACSNGWGGEACLEGEESTNLFKATTSRVRSYQAGRQVSEEVFVFAGMNGRTSGRSLSIDWAGVGQFENFTQRQSYLGNGAVEEVVSPYRTDEGEVRRYTHYYRRGILDGMEDDAGAEFIVPDQNAIGVNAAGGLSHVNFRNGTQATYGSDDMHRLTSMTVTGPMGADYWASGTFGYGPSGRITAIGGQDFAYDLAGRLSAASVLPQAKDPSRTARDELQYEYDEFGNMTTRDWSTEQLPDPGAPTGLEFASRDFGSTPSVNENKVQDPGFAYDANGNMVRMIKSDATYAGMVWDAWGRLASFYQDDPDSGGHPAESYTYDAGRFRLVQYGHGGDGGVRIAIRNDGGRSLADWVIEPSTGRPTLETGYVYGLGQLLVVREPDPGVSHFAAQSTLAVNDEYGFELIDGDLSATYTVDVRSHTGVVSQTAGVAPDSLGRFWIPESALDLDATNFVRIKKESATGEVYSVPTTVSVDSTVTSQSDNQVRAFAVTRDGTNIRIRWDLYVQNGQRTYIYFERPTGQKILLTPFGVAPGTNNYALPEQTIGPLCGSLFTRANSTSSGEDSLKTEIGSPDSITHLQPLEPACGGVPPLPSPPLYSFADHYQHRDYLGSLRVVTDEAGAAVMEYDYYPFGAVMDGGGGSGDLYTGHRRDGVTGADYMVARYRDAGSPCLMSSDPVLGGGVGGWNRNVYVSGDPVNFNDPSGLQRATPFHEVDDPGGLLWNMDLQTGIPIGGLVVGTQGRYTRLVGPTDVVYEDRGTCYAKITNNGADVEVVCPFSKFVTVPGTMSFHSTGGGGGGGGGGGTVLPSLYRNCLAKHFSGVVPEDLAVIRIESNSDLVPQGMAAITIGTQIMYSGSASRLLAEHKLLIHEVSHVVNDYHLSQNPNRHLIFWAGYGAEYVLGRLSGKSHFAAYWNLTSEKRARSYESQAADLTKCLARRR